MLLNRDRLAVCYFGIYEPRWARDTVLLRGLRQRGVSVVFCADSSPGWRKYWRLVKKHRRLRQAYDYLLVGYLSNIVVPLARLLSRRPVIFNAGNAMYEGSVLDRGHRSWLKKERYIWFVDFLAFKTAHLVILETKAQQEFVSRAFWVSKSKILVLPTGADDQAFFPDRIVAKRPGFWVVFRGWFVPATGVEYILEAAGRLGQTGVSFLIIGRGPMRRLVEEKILAAGFRNVELITEFLPGQALRRLMLSCHVMLGQFSGHPRLERTVQNKTYEALALGMPYITQKSLSNEEWLIDGRHCLFTRPADPADLVDKILLLRGDEALRQRLAMNGRILYEKTFTPQAIGTRFLQFLAGLH